MGASCVSKLKLPLLRVLTLFSLPVPGSVVHPPPPLAISTPGWMQAWRQQISPLKEEVPSVNDGDPDMSNGNFWGQFSLVDSVTLETEAGYTVCLKGLPTRTRRLSILEKACPDPASPDFNVRLLSGCIITDDAPNGSSMHSTASTPPLDPGSHPLLSLLSRRMPAAEQ